MKRKIADCVNIRVKTGDFQHIEIVKYAEEEIEYNDSAERIAKEDALTSSLVESIMRSLHSIPERIGKGKAEVIEVEQAISKAIPAWLANDPVPNIANQAKKVLNTVSDRQKAEKDKAVVVEKNVLNDDNDGKMIKKTKVNQVKKEDPVIGNDVADLFESETTVAIPVEPKAEAEVKSDKKDDGFDLFSDSEDLFGDNK